MTLEVVDGPKGFCAVLTPGSSKGINVPYWLESVNLPPCKVNGGVAKVAPAINPSSLAVSYWTTIPLPVPRPSLPPGYAVTGKPIYLVTGGTVQPPPFVKATPLGLLTIRATGTYSVDWGDGSRPTWSGPYEQEGEPWPSGEIDHTYDVAGKVRVTVVEHWSASWSLAGVTGTLGGLHTEASIAAFPVEQLQAIITN
jgi:hypothetical protein